MGAIVAWLIAHVKNFPLVVFIALLLGGFNLPISEDVLVATSAALCQNHKTSILLSYLAIFFGASLSDWMVYFWGWLLGRGIISNRFFKSIVKKENTLRFAKALEKYGIFAYIVVRFIPFGVRNIISMTSGFVGFRFCKFALFDSIAVLCNTSVLFWLVYFFGRAGGKYMRILGLSLFIAFIVFCFYLFRSKKFVQLLDKHLEGAPSNKDLK